MFLSEDLRPGLTGSKKARFQGGSTLQTLAPKMGVLIRCLGRGEGAFIWFGKLDTSCPADVSVSVSETSECFLLKPHPDTLTSVIILHNLLDRPWTLTERDEVEMIRPPLV